MDPYAAQTYLPPSSSQIQPQIQTTQDQYVYNQQYDPSQHYPYYPQITQQQQQEPYPNAVYQQQPAQETAVVQPPGVQIQPDPTHVSAYQHGYEQTQFQNDPNLYYPQQPQQQQLSYPDPGMDQQVQQQWQQQSQQQWQQQSQQQWQQQDQQQWPQQEQQQWQQQQAQTVDYGVPSVYPSNGQAQYNVSGRTGGRPISRGASSARGRGRGKGRGPKTTIGPRQPPAWCELCRVECTTLEILETHKNGKKHKKNMKLQEDLEKLATKTHEAETGQVAAETEVDGNGLKRKMPETIVDDSSKKPKEIVPFICELCDVKCESGPTFDSHLKGKKHIFNVQMFQEQQQAMMGQAALEALLLQAILQPFLPQILPSVLPQGPNLGGTHEGVIEGAKNEVGPVGSKVESQMEPKSKVEEINSKIVEKAE